MVVDVFCFVWNCRIQIGWNTINLQSIVDGGKIGKIIISIELKIINAKCRLLKSWW
jgi:hypothetical protein